MQKGWTLEEALKLTLTRSAQEIWLGSKADFLDPNYGYYRAFTLVGECNAAPEMKAAATLIECPFWELLESERLETFGRPRDLANEHVRIDGRMWKFLRAINFPASAALDEKTGNVLFCDIRVFSVESSGAAESGVPLAMCFDSVEENLATASGADEEPIVGALPIPRLPDSQEKYMQELHNKTFPDGIPVGTSDKKRNQLLRTKASKRNLAYPETHVIHRFYAHRPDLWTPS